MTEVSSEGRGGSDCGAVWVDGDLLFGALAIAGALYAYFLYTTITMKGRRRKKRKSNNFFPNQLSYYIAGNYQTVTIKFHKKTFAFFIATVDS